MKLPKQGPSLLRNRRLHPYQGRFAGLAGVSPSQEFDMEDMEGMDDMQDYDGDDDAGEGE